MRPKPTVPFSNTWFIATSKFFRMDEIVDPFPKMNQGEPTLHALQLEKDFAKAIWSSGPRAQKNKEGELFSTPKSDGTFSHTRICRK